MFFDQRSWWQMGKQRLGLFCTSFAWTFKEEESLKSLKKLGPQRKLWVLDLAQTIKVQIPQEVHVLSCCWEQFYMMVQLRYVRWSQRVSHHIKEQNQHEFLFNQNLLFFQDLIASYLQDQVFYFITTERIHLTLLALTVKKMKFLFTLSILVQTFKWWAL